MSDQEAEDTNTYYQDDAYATALINQHLRNGVAMRPPKVGKTKPVCVRITETAHTGLKQIAEQLGYTHGGNANVSMLLEAIGSRTVQVTQLQLQARRQ